MIKQQNLPPKEVFWVKLFSPNINTVFIGKNIVLKDCLNINSAARK